MVNIKKTNREITKKLGTIENALKRKLNAFYNNNIKGSILPIESLQLKYNTTIRNIIRKTVQDGYQAGSNLVTDQISNINSDFVPFISVTDVQNIQLVTDKVSNQFWKTSGRLHRRETEFIAAPDGLEPKPEFDTIAAMIGLASFATFSAFNNAVISKIQILNNPIELGIGTSVFQNSQFDFGSGQGSIFINAGEGNTIELKGQIMFLTKEDSKVDPEICEPLNRKIYGPDDFSDVPELPLHNHCRCRLIPLIQRVFSETERQEFTERAPPEF